MEMQVTKNGAMNLLSQTPMVTVTIPTRTINIDGNADDWAGIDPVVEDPQNDLIPGTTRTSGVDIKAVYMARDENFIYFMMTLWVGNPDTDTMYVAEFQQYLNQLHTPGDVNINAVYGMTPDSPRWDVNVGRRGSTGRDPVLWYTDGYAAAGAGMLEWKAPIAALKFPPATPLPYFSPITPLPADQGIENEVIRTYIHPSPGVEPVSDENNGQSRPMIVNFWDQTITGRG